MKSAFLRNAIVLGMLSAIGPFAIDMYLPAFPAIARDLAVDIRAVQMSLMSFFLAVALCQVLYGPISDRVGRKRPIYFGLTLFVIGGIGCSFATSAEALIALRFVQGVGACASMVITRAIIRDLHTGHEAARLMATTMLVFSVSPDPRAACGQHIDGVLQLARHLLGDCADRRRRHRRGGFSPS